MCLVFTTESWSRGARFAALSRKSVDENPGAG